MMVKPQVQGRKEGVARAELSCILSLFRALSWVYLITSAPLIYIEIETAAQRGHVSYLEPPSQ
jgi:hypothetical protein